MTSTSRVRVSALLALAIMLGATLPAGATTPAGKQRTDAGGVLAVVLASSATSDAPDRVVLHDVHPRAVYFSDRPNRVTGSIDLASFIEAATADGPAPNGALTGVPPGQDEEVVVVADLTTMEYDEPARELRLSVRPLERAGGGLAHYRGRNETELPAELEQVSLFIDSVSCPGIGIENETSDKTLTLSSADPVVNPSDGQGGTYVSYVSAPTQTIPPGSTGSFVRMGGAGCDATVTYSISGTSATVSAIIVGDIDDGTFDSRCKVVQTGSSYSCSASKVTKVKVYGP
jgi:hypothetical protein